MLRDQEQTFAHSDKSQRNALCSISQVAELFGGLEICSLAVLVGKDGKETILKASDCTFTLLGDTQEEDRRMVADIVTARMQVSLKTFQSSIDLKNSLIVERLSTTTPQVTVTTWS
jgi:Synapsin, ATP binding domain